MDLMQMIQQSISQLTATTDERTRALQAQAAQINKAADTVANLGGKSIQAQRQAAELGAQAAAQKANTDSTVLFSKQQIDDIFGVDPEQNTSVIQKRMAEYTAAEDARKIARQEYDTLTQTSLLENPIGYILNQMKLPSVAARHNAIVDVRDAAAKDISVRQSLAAAQRNIQIPNVATDLKITALLSADKDRADAESRVLAAEGALASQVAGLKLQAFQLSDRALDAKGDFADRLLRFASLQEQREATAAQRAATQADRDARAQILREAATKKQQDQAVIDSINSRLAAGGQFLGMAAPPTVQGLDKLGNAKTQNDWSNFAANGVLGRDIASSLAFMETYGNIPVMSQQNPLAVQTYQGLKAGLQSFRTTATMQARGNPQLSELIKKPGALNEWASNEYARELWMSATSVDPQIAKLTDSRYDTLFNPYRVNHKLMLSGDPKVPGDNAMIAALQASTIGKEGEIANMPNIPAALEVNAFQSIIERVAKGALGVDAAAAQIVQYYQAGVKNNLQAYQYTTFGIPAQRSYMVQLPAPGLFGDPIMFNATNFASVKAALAKTARQSIRQFAPGFTGIPSPIRPGVPAQ